MRDRKVIATDVDPEMVALSTAVAGGRVIGGSLPDLPFEDDAFDAVTANFVINHLPDPRAGMRELARVVRPGGRVAATIWPAQPAEWAVLVAGTFGQAHDRLITARMVAVKGAEPEDAFDFDDMPGWVKVLACSAVPSSFAGTQFLVVRSGAPA